MNIGYYKKELQVLLYSVDFFWNEVTAAKENFSPRKFTVRWFEVQEQLQGVLRGMKVLLTEDQARLETPPCYHIQLVHEEVQAIWNSILRFTEEDVVHEQTYLLWRELHIETKELRRLLAEIYLIE